MIRFIQTFLRLEAAGGLVLMAVAAVAMLIANSPFLSDYEAFLALRPLGVPMAFLVNDGLMAIFFLVIGIEIKREFIEGDLSTRSAAMLPIFTAIGGVIIPALIYSFHNHSVGHMRGWAIPTATDIAFSLGVLSLFGRRLPSSLKVFLMALAVIDDLAAIIIIALFYGGNLNVSALFFVFASIGILWVLGNNGVMRLWVYLVAGVVLWISMLQSGVHPTIAGVLLGLLMPLKKGKAVLEKIHPVVAFGIMPLFAFVNAGVSLTGVTMEQFQDPVVFGIIGGLFYGKFIGIAATAWLLCRLRLARLPQGVNWVQFFAVCLLAGIGFTMSLFIGDLAFHGNKTLILNMKLGVITGSLLSAFCCCLMLLVALKAGSSSHRMREAD